MQRRGYIMNRLLFVELKRAITSPVLWAGIIAMIILPAYEIVWSGYGFQVYTTTFLLSDTSKICIFMAVFIPLHTGHDFESRTINNKITAGYKRKQIYFAEVIVSAVCASILLVINTVAGFVFSAVKHLEFSDGITCTKFFIDFVLSLIGIITISAVFTMIVMIVHKELLSIALAVLMALFLLNTGSNAVSDLMQPEYKLDAERNEMTENPLYLSGIKRTAANVHLLISPFAQAEYEEFMLYETPEEKQNNSAVFLPLFLPWS